MMKDHAALSKISYRAGRGEKSINEGLKKNRLDKRMEYVPELSNEDHVTFFDKDRQKAVVAYRGTRLDDPGDLFTDLSIYFGVQRFTPRFDDALKTAKRARKMFGDGNVELTGHSLGGSQALYATSKTGIPSHAFNPGKGYHKPNMLEAYDNVAGRLNPAFDRLNRDNATVYTTGLDPISFNSIKSPAELQLVRPTQLDVHGIDNFL